MYFDLNFPIASPIQQTQTKQQSSKKGKGKQQATTNAVQVVYSPAQIAKVEARLGILVRLGYTVIALNQIVESKVDPKTHVNILDPLLLTLRKREGVLLLKRLTIVLDGESEKGFGLTNANAPLFTSYDILALHTTTHSSFSLACLTHSLPSPLTAHIISIPCTAPRLPFNLKHTLVRTAIKNGAVFEVCVAGAVKEGKGGDAGESERRNWWAAAREIVRVTKGKGLVVSGGAETVGEARAPRDAENLLCLLGLAQNLAHDATSVTPKSLLIRAQTRKTYRAILSEPKLIMPTKSAVQATQSQEEGAATNPELQATSLESNTAPNVPNNAVPGPSTSSIPTLAPPHPSTPTAAVTDATTQTFPTGKKRPREETETEGSREGLPSKRPVPAIGTTPAPTQALPSTSDPSKSTPPEKQLQPSMPTNLVHPLPSKPVSSKANPNGVGTSAGLSTLPATPITPALWTESSSAKKRKKKKTKVGAGGTSGS